MDEELIKRHNEVVRPDDIVIHAGDFTLGSQQFAENIIKRLNGLHKFIRGSHDYWRGAKHPTMWEKDIDGQYVVVCHYAMRTWPRSHYNSWQLYGHSHGGLPSFGKSYDIGVDNNNFYPVSFEQLKIIMGGLEDNFNLVQK